MESKNKKKVQLKEEQVGYLTNLPETGMGYQLVKLTLKNGQVKRDRVVLNSQFLLLDDSEDIDPDLIDNIELERK